MRKLLLVGWQSFCGNKQRKELLWIFFNDSFRYDNGGGVYLEFINSGGISINLVARGYCAGLVWPVMGDTD